MEACDDDFFFDSEDNHQCGCSLNIWYMEAYDDDFFDSEDNHQCSSVFRIIYPLD